MIHDLATLGDQHPVRRTETCRGELVVGIAPGVDVLRYRLGDARRLLLEARLELLFGGVVDDQSHGHRERAQDDEHDRNR